MLVEDWPNVLDTEIISIVFYFAIIIAGFFYIKHKQNMWPKAQANKIITDSTEKHDDSSIEMTSVPATFQFNEINKVKKTAKISKIIAAVLLVSTCCLSALSYYEYQNYQNLEAKYYNVRSLKKETDQKYADLKAEYSNIVDEYNFFHDYAVIVTEHGTKYHHYGCYHIKDQDFYIYNIDNAKHQGYTPCKDCFT